jgi:hypothetical protein
MVGGDIIINCLGIPEQVVMDEEVFPSTNVDLLKVFLEEMILLGKTRLCYVSTFEMFKEKGRYISENHGILESDSGLSNYYRSMFNAFQMTSRLCLENGILLGTIHPAAVFGGKNTGHGVTEFIDNLVHNRFWRIPFIVRSHFPVVHIDSLCDAIIRSLGKSGSWIVSDGMTSLREIALIVNEAIGTRIPSAVPVSLAKGAAVALETVARMLKANAPITRKQLMYVTSNSVPIAEKAQVELGWVPQDIKTGIDLTLMGYSPARMQQERTAL